MVNIAILGYGTVGSGVAKLAAQNKELFAAKVHDEVFVKYILDIRDFPGDEFEDRLTKRFEDIVEDPTVSVVCEVIGGVGVAYEFTRRCLSAGKHVVTSNKELVAQKGPELMALAYTNNVRYLFEASVGGGIPILHPLRECTEANRITRVVGILNGTTNYILTKMFAEGVSFDDALADAQRLGYAEQDPSADVDGKDACRKICILASLAFGKHVPPEKVQTVGIRALTGKDVRKAEEAGCRIKLLGCAEKRDDGTVEMFVRPCAVPATSVLANVCDVFNAVVVTGDAVGDVTFCGRGAGKMPTASAVCADVLEILSGSPNAKTVLWEDGDGSFVRPFDPSLRPMLEGTDIPIMER